MLICHALCLQLDDGTPQPPTIPLKIEGSTDTTVQDFSYCNTNYAGIDYLSFLDLDFTDLIYSTQDGSSHLISLPTGLPFGNSIQTTAYVRWY